MDAQTVSTNPAQSPQDQPPKSAFGTVSDKIKNLTGKQKVAIVVIALILIAGLIYWLMNRSSSSGPTSPNVTIVRVGDTSIPGSFLNFEESYYPEARTEEVRKLLTQKLIDDQITLEEGKKEGLIGEYPDSKNMSSEEYLKRTSLVEEIKNKINDQAVNLEAEVISIWFYNNGQVGPLGYEKEKALAFKKINEYYSKVKSQQLTMKQAGEQVASDQELIDSFMNVSLKENSYIILKSENSQPMSFWPEFDAQLRQLNPGEITPIFEGTDTDATGKVIPNLYAFGQVTKKSESSSVNYQTWLADKKSKYEISY